MPTGLPPGLVLEPSTGVISGTPTEAGTWTFTVRAVDSVGQVTQQARSMTVYNLVLTNAAPDGADGVVYSHTYAASGGLAPYTYAVSSGSLPFGLSLAAGGALTGTPTTPATYVFTVRVTDANGFTEDLAESVLIEAASI